jgi:hypothetical protein
LPHGYHVRYLFSMAIETIGEAYDWGWRVTVRCAWGPRDGMKRRRECVYGGELDIESALQEFEALEAAAISVSQRK